MIAAYAVTIFTSAFLLFQVQPLISKFILPWFGGSPAVWTAAMLFFQVVLFGGYLYAHLTSTYLTPRAQFVPARGRYWRWPRRWRSIRRFHPAKRSSRRATKHRRCCKS